MMMVDEPWRADVGHPRRAELDDASSAGSHSAMRWAR
jgi:hypothetical protein